MTIDAWITAGVLAAMFALLIPGRFGADIVLMGALLTLLVTGVVDPGPAVQGFANPAVITVAMLYVVATAMRETGAMQMLIGRLLGRPKSVLAAQAKLIVPVAISSAFVNNTPIVAMFLPVLHQVAKRCNLPTSKLFMPLSFASILGGVCTLIGTSTTVLVAGLLITENITDADGEPVRLSMFTLSAVGLPIALLGVAYMLVFGRSLLPDRIAPDDQTSAKVREYLAPLRVTGGSPIIGKTVEAAGLRHLPGLFLSRIDRMDHTIVAVGPEELIEEGDVLVFVGALDSLVDVQKIKGLEPVADGEKESVGYRPNLKLIEAVLAPSSPLVGQTIRDAQLRSRYGAVVVAVHRQGYRLRGKVGDIRLRSGDTLLLEAPQRFAERYRNSPEFHLVSALDDTPTLRHERAWISLAILVGLIVALSVGVSTMIAAMGAAGLMILTRCCTGPQARSGMDWQVLVVIGAAFGLGEAMRTTGLASVLADSLVGAASGAGPWVLLGVVYFATVLFTMSLTNNAAAVLMFPIAMGIAQADGLNPLPFAIVVAVAASCEFST
ncbi:MAG: SLC13 family permease, partial [Myxococcota bacterium]